LASSGQGAAGFVQLAGGGALDGVGPAVGDEQGSVHALRGGAAAEVVDGADGVVAGQS